MKMTLLINLLLGVALLAILGCIQGCSLLSQKVTNGIAGLPTMQHCQKVTYTRENQDVTVTANCRIPPPDPAGLGLASIIK